MEVKRCKICAGSGKIMGGGMLIKDCEKCHGTGKITVKTMDEHYEDFKKTKSYKNSIKKILAADSQLTPKDADKIFKNEFYKFDGGEI